MALTRVIRGEKMRLEDWRGEERGVEPRLLRLMPGLLDSGQ